MGTNRDLTENEANGSAQAANCGSLLYPVDPARMMRHLKVLTFALCRSRRSRDSSTCKMCRSAVLQQFRRSVVLHALYALSQHSACCLCAAMTQMSCRHFYSLGRRVRTCQIWLKDQSNRFRISTSLCQHGGASATAHRVGLVLSPDSTRISTTFCISPCATQHP